MKYRLYATSRKAWAGMLKAIETAQHSIYMEMYSFLPGPEGTGGFFDLIKKKALAGVEVVLIADAFGSLDLSAKTVASLREAGVEFIYFSHWLQRTHRKILIVDNKYAFIGGVNINDKNRNWLDLQIGLAGRIVKPLLQTFASNYKNAGGKRESVLKYSRLPLSKKIKAWVIDNVPKADSLYNINRYYKDKIGQAQKSILIVTPYLLPPRWLLAALDDACRRGVDVEMIIPNDTDIKLLNRVNYLNACRLADVGVKFFLMPVMNHAKIMIVDGEEGVIGSQNIDILSFEFNMEAGIFFRQKKLVEDLQKIVFRWRSDSVSLVSQPRRRFHLLDYIAIMVLKIFHTIF